MVGRLFMPCAPGLSLRGRGCVSRGSLLGAASKGEADMRVPLKYNFRNILARKTTFVLTAVGIALAVLIFVALSSLVQGMRAAVSNTGLPDNVVILSQGAVSIPTSLLDQSVIQEIKY